MNYTILNLRRIIDYNYSQYKTQRDSLSRREENLKDKTISSFKLLIIFPAAAVITYILALFVTSLTSSFGRNDATSLIIGLLFVASLFSLIIAILYVPIQAKVFFDNLHRYWTLTEKLKPDFIDIKSRVKSFRAERSFLDERIKEIEDFNRKYEAIYGLTSEKPLETSEDEETDAAMAEEMRSLSIFKDYHAEDSLVLHEGMTKYMIVLFLVILIAAMFFVARTMLGK